MVLSLVTAVGSGAFVYKTMKDKSGSTVTVPLKNVERLASPDQKPTPPPAATFKSEDFKSKDTLRNIQFNFISSTAKQVYILGNFFQDKDDAKESLSQEGKKWSVNLKLKPGTYQYMYLVDGKKIRDPYNKKTVNGKSVITVKPLAG